MRSCFFLFALFTLSCFKFEVDGGVLSCPDDLCPDGLACAHGICFEGEEFCESNEGVCAVEEGGACVSNLGCTLSPQCPIDAVQGAVSCTSGVVCVDADTLEEDAPLFQSGEAKGVCVPQLDLEEGDDCTPFDVTERCPDGTGCSERGVCEERAGEEGDTCDAAIALNGPGTFLFNIAGLANDSLSDPVGDCGGAGDGADLFLRYTVERANVDVIISSSNNGTLSDTLVYVGDACDNDNLAVLANELACNDDNVADNFNDFSSEVVLSGLAPGQEIFIVVDSFLVGRDGFVELSVEEE